MTDHRSWIVAQIGAREHYAIARGLHQQGRLQALITDAWAAPDSWVRALPAQLFRSLHERYHPGLADAFVHHFTLSLLWFELQSRLRRIDGWDRMIARNDWFQARAVAALQHIVKRQRNVAKPPVLFSYSYAAQMLLQGARSLGCRTVLGQIDAGPHEEDLVAAQHERYPHLSKGTTRVPASYWEAWRAECAAADTIVVNSAWSRKALTIAGIADEKIQVVPLIYESTTHRTPPRNYPAAFTRNRPLQVLFLGTLTLRKGLGQLLEAVDLLSDAPVHWTIVGEGDIRIPEPYRQHPRMTWVGRVPRAAVEAHYEAADVFILPTISDGFALTQLEAQAHGLPVIASQRCGDVVKHRRNGLRLGDVSPEAIAESLTWCLSHPQALADMSTQALHRVHDFSEANVIPQLLATVKP
jgi:glycosyltransferase involved in cell wall biosynthesis